MRRYIFLSGVLLLVLGGLQAQILKPVKWSYGAKKVGKDEAVVFFKASIDSGWHVYSQYVKVGGPIPTSFSYDRSAEYVLVGKTIEPKPIARMEKTFNMNVGYYERSVIFQQKVKLKKGQATVTGSLEYMTCNDKQCLPPEDVKFSVPIN